MCYLASEDTLNKKEKRQERLTFLYKKIRNNPGNK